LEYLGWHFNTFAQGAVASVVGGKHATTACELGTPTTASTAHELGTQTMALNTQHLEHQQRLKTWNTNNGIKLWEVFLAFGISLMAFPFFFPRCCRKRH
jgi:hypothetical protein